MGPKIKSEGKGGAKTKIPALTDPVNTDEWSCVASLAVEKSSAETYLLEYFEEAAASGLRPQVKSITLQKVIRVVQSYGQGQVDPKYELIKSFPAVFQPAAAALKSNPEGQLPTVMVANIIKVLTFIIKIEDANRIEKLKNTVNPIIAMSKRPNACPTGKGEPASKAGKVDKNKKPQAVATKPISPQKEGSMLTKRGYSVSEEYCVDDAPSQACFQHYIMLSQFHDPDLPLALLSAGVPLHGIFCVGATTPVPCTCRASVISQPQGTAQIFWSAFLKILWDRTNVLSFKDLVLQAYTPPRVPTEREKVKEFLYTELSFLMYDLADYKRQHKGYLKNMALRDVTMKPGEKVEVLERHVEELDEVCADKVTVPIVMQFILDILCGEDGLEEEEDVEEESSGTQTSEQEYPKMLNLYEEYVGEEASVVDSLCPSNTIVYSCTSYKKSTYSPNLYNALHPEESGGPLANLWSNYPLHTLEMLPSVDSVYSCGFPVHIADPTVEYCLFALWILSVPCLAEGKSPQSPSPSSSRTSYPSVDSKLIDTHFTITDCSRRILKACRPRDLSQDFFYPLELKVMPVVATKTFSEPRIPPSHGITFVSDLNIPTKFLDGKGLDVYENLRSFLGEKMFENTNGFDLVEEHSKVKMWRAVNAARLKYNCMDVGYSKLTDSIYLVFHNRTDSDSGVFRHVYHASVRTPVGLRDFFEYVLEDEHQWLDVEEKKHRSLLKTAEQNNPNVLYSPKFDFIDFGLSDFLLEGSIKQQMIEAERAAAEAAAKLKINTVKGKEKPNAKGKEKEKVKPKKADKDVFKSPGAISKIASPMFAKLSEPHAFEGFDISNIAVQFSGFTTVFYADGCQVRVELEERLYGTQNLGLFVTQGGHMLCLHSYVCPTPHRDEPLTFHVNHSNGAIFSFSERVDRTHDLTLTLPSTLVVRPVWRNSQRCYITQEYLIIPFKVCQGQEEMKRLYLPNGSLVKIFKDRTLQIIRATASITRAALNDLVFKVPRQREVLGLEEEGEIDEVEKYLFQNFEAVSPSGRYYMVVDELLVSDGELSCFTNLDYETQAIYTRRRDCTYTAHLPTGMLCTQFMDGTKLTTSYYIDDEHYCLEDALDWPEQEGEHYWRDPFVSVQLRYTFEHPYYATAIYDTGNLSWIINTPDESSVKVYSDGHYVVSLDESTELEVTQRTVQMCHFNDKCELQCDTFVDLDVFNKVGPRPVYATTIDKTGRKFVVEANGHCYVREEEMQCEEDLSTEELPCASEEYLHLHLPCLEEAEPKVQLSPDSRYFVCRRDNSGLELLHQTRACQDIATSSMTFTDIIPTPEHLRYFVLLQPSTEKPLQERWRMSYITPEVRYETLKHLVPFRTTYAEPPSWTHPFPKQRKVVTVPDDITCRLLIETKDTRCFQFPTSGGLEFATMELVEPKLTKLEENKKRIKEYFSSVADDDPDALRELYGLAMKSKMNAGKRHCPVGGDKLSHYLHLSEYYVKLQEHHKTSLRCCCVPNYFDHPGGMSWLILQDIINELKDAKLEDVEPPLLVQKPDVSPLLVQEPDVSPLSFTPVSSKEIEYNLDVSTKRSFSDLSYRSSMANFTAPAAYGRPYPDYYSITPRLSHSAPRPLDEDTTEHTVPPPTTCSFTSEDIRKLSKSNPGLYKK